MPGRGRRGPWIIGAFALVAVVVVAFVVTRSPGTASTIGATRWSSYRVVYREHFPNAVRYEDLSVRRPYEASDLNYVARSSKLPLSGAVSTERALYDVQAGGGLVLVGGREPGPPSGDQDLATQMPELIARHLAVDLKRSRRVARRPCHVFRMYESPSGPIKPLKDDTQHDDLCIAAGGLVLSERWIINGNLGFERTATKVEREAQPLPSVTSATQPDAQQLAGAAIVVRRPKSFLASPQRPSGFRARRVVEMSFAVPSPMGATTNMRTVAWAFSSGARTISVEAGGPAPTPWQDGDTVTRPARLKHLGRATTAIRSDGAEIRVALPRGRWIRIRGTVPLPTLVRYANELKLL